MNNWRELFFDKSLCSGKVINNGSGNITVTGHLKEGNMNSKIMFFCCRSPKFYHKVLCKRITKILDPDIAFHNTTNVGAVKAGKWKFQNNIRLSNSYYVGLGSLYVPLYI